MKIEIWSDFACPFCYIGKRKLEQALEKFPHKEGLTIEWKSYQLAPDTVSQPGKDIHDYLAERKGQSREWAMQMNENVSKMAADAGLKYDMNKVVIANTFDAHRLSQFALTKGKQDEVEEKLFSAYFTEGKDIADSATLIEIAKSCKLDEDEVSAMLNTSDYSEIVDKDIAEAGMIGVRGVPFFVFDRKYAISGAQPEEVFLNTLDKAFSDAQS